MKNVLITLVPLASTVVLNESHFYRRNLSAISPVTPEMVGKSQLPYGSPYQFLGVSKVRGVETLKDNIDAVKAALFARNNVTDNELAERLEVAAENLIQP